MEQRCRDQVSNCLGPESDENDCVTVVVKDNYNNAPFTFNKESNTIIPVNVDISVDVREGVSE